MASSFSSPWPDPNSPVLSKIDFGVPLVELFKWLEVRDTLLGDHGKKQDITAALTLAHDCKHPDAVWLTSIFEGKDVSSTAEAEKVLLSWENDARALCFAWCMNDDRQNDLSLLRRASEMGNAFACSTLSEFLEESMEEAFRLAEVAAAQLERNGFFRLAYLWYEAYEDPEQFQFLGPERLEFINISDEYEKNTCIAAELGYSVAARNYGEFVDGESVDWVNFFDPGRWVWYGRAASKRFSSDFLYYFPEQVQRFFSGSGNATVVFLIGRALKGNIDVEKKLMFDDEDQFKGGGSNYFDSIIGPANQALSFYESQIKSARLAVDTWTLVSTRLHMVMDMRIYIGKMIWEGRFEANYAIENDPRASRHQKRSRK